MGEIVASMELENTDDRGIVSEGLRDESTVRRTTVEGVVDTGAVMLMLPEDVVGRLGLRTRRQVAVTYADERREIRSVAGPVTVHIGNRFMIAECVVGPPSSEPLIGQIVLEALDLVADCANRTVGPRPESPDRPLLKLKRLVPAETLPMPDAHPSMTPPPPPHGHRGSGVKACPAPRKRGVGSWPCPFPACRAPRCPRRRRCSIPPDVRQPREVREILLP